MTISPRSLLVRCRRAGCRRGWWRSEEGATAAEYAIMASLIAVVIIAAVIALGGATRNQFCEPVNEWGTVDSGVNTDEC